VEDCEILKKNARGMMGKVAPREKIGDEVAQFMQLNPLSYNSIFIMDVYL
jgi:hypothetical protein